MLSSFRHAVQCLKTRRKTPSAQRAERSFPPPFALSSCGNQRSALFIDCSQKLCKNFWGFPVTNSPVLSLLKGKNISVPSAAVLLLDLRGHPPITYSEKRQICAPYYNLDTIPPSILSFSLFSCTLYKARKKDQIISKSKVYPRHPDK